MIRRSTRILAAVVVMMLSTQAHAQGGSADSMAKALGQCIVLKSTGEDRLQIARWLLAAMASAPQMSGVVTIQPGKKVEADRNMAKLLTRLLVRDCAAEAKPVFKDSAQTGFRTAGQALGTVAMTELMSNPQAMAAIAEYGKYLVQDEFKALLP